MKEVNKEYRESDPVLYKKMQGDSYMRNRNNRLKEAKIYYKQNKDKIKENTYNYRKNNPDKIKELNDNYLEKRKLLNKNRRRTDPIFKCKDNIRRRINTFLRHKGTKIKSTQDILGCDWATLYNHLCSTFELNYGLGREYIPWGMVHIDHKKPLKSATCVEDIYSLNNYKNLQLLFAQDNLKKSGKDADEDDY
jgi:hypothetical protein